ncbi:hypothetical protein EMPG_12380 [Blastomyces silverae]|uniref:Uncharacterized protein n=1 Tax=Blastomyces silverae TaxID=2060906 RepID=A0A0H1BM50_9EURO|nr:hypothetical protein EMPG_12380 [Blastomyces silverae]
MEHLVGISLAAGKISSGLFNSHSKRSLGQAERAAALRRSWRARKMAPFSPTWPLQKFGDSERSRAAFTPTLFVCRDSRSRCKRITDYYHKTMRSVVEHCYQSFPATGPHPTANRLGRNGSQAKMPFLHLRCKSRDHTSPLRDSKK